MFPVDKKDKPVRLVAGIRPSFKFGKEPVGNGILGFQVYDPEILNFLLPDIGMDTEITIVRDDLLPGDPFDVYIKVIQCP